MAYQKRNYYKHNLRNLLHGIWYLLLPCWMDESITQQCTQFIPMPWQCNAMTSLRRLKITIVTMDVSVFFISPAKNKFLCFLFKQHNMPSIYMLFLLLLLMLLFLGFLLLLKILQHHKTKIQNNKKLHEQRNENCCPGKLSSMNVGYIVGFFFFAAIFCICCATILGPYPLL